MTDIKIINPDALGKPLGQYSQITRVKASEFLFIAGQLGVEPDRILPFSAKSQAGHASLWRAIQAAAGITAPGAAQK